MGLDNYFRRTGASPLQIVFPSDLRLCGGMFSGHGIDGSFRGKVYTEFFETNMNANLYCDFDTEEVARIAERLSGLVVSLPGEAWTEEGWQEDAPSETLGYYGVTAREVRDLAALFQAAAEQKLQLVASY